MATTHRGALEWARLVDEWRRSGLSLPQFCRQHDIKTGTMSGWVYKPKLQRVIENARKRNADKPVVPASIYPPNTVKPAPAFVPVRLRQFVSSTTIEPVPRSAIEVIVGAGRRVIVERGFDAETLRRVVAALESGPC
jgi:hypothetical protein